MRRLLLISALVVALAFLLVGTAAADNGPHQGDFTTTDDACAGCHRVHRGVAENLLKSGDNQTQFCFACHGSTGTGADTNVEDGVYTDNRNPDGTWGANGAGLRGGGFAKALMDPGLTGTPGSADTTSKHDTSASGTIWGNGAITTTVSAGTSVVLECGSCHDPHGITGGDTYRILRPTPNDSGAASGVTVEDEPTKNYTITYYGANASVMGQTSRDYLAEYRDVMIYLGPIDQSQEMAEWCAQCHTRYLADDFSSTGDAIFDYPHATHVLPADDAFGNALVCQTCHVAHGTSATMGTFSDAVEWPDGSAATSGANSRLLHVNNRGVCIQCHNPPGDDSGCLECHQGP